MEIEGKNIVLAVTGGIAAYKALDLVSLLKKSGATVNVVMTRSACEFVRPLSFQTLSAQPVGTSLFQMTAENEIEHIKLAGEADLYMVAPATANIIGKFSHGIADDLVSTLFLATKAPVVLAPAMNCKMWENPAVQNNMALLRERGVQIVEPEYGMLACGEMGQGRLASVQRIFDKISILFNKRELPLKGEKVLVTAGPTVEKIDAARYLSNYSSGKMGYAIAESCQAMGASVTLVSGPTALPLPDVENVVQVKSAKEMFDAIISQADQYSLIIKSAAVADYRVENPPASKIKKKDQLTLELVKNPDILETLGKRKQPGQYLVGFAAESNDLEKYAKGKLERKNLDLIVANNILEAGAGFDGDTNKVLLIERDGKTELPLMTKKELAEKIIQHVIDSDRWEQVLSER